MSLLLLDTHVLVWTAGLSERLSASAQRLIADQSNTLVFSAVSIWEASIKASLRRADFQVDSSRLRHGLLAGGFRELDITSEHAIAVGHPPWLHRDPFDRLLLAQAAVEKATLVTADPTLARYPGAIELLT